MTMSLEPFKILAHDKLPFALSSNRNFQICPTMDLISFQLNGSTLWVYRLQNTKVWTIELSSDETEADIESMCWRPDGKVFAIITNNGSIALYDSRNGEPVMDFKTDKNVEFCNWLCEESNVENPYKSSDLSLCDLNVSASLPKLASSSSDNGKKPFLVDDLVMKSEDSELDFLLLGSEGGVITVIIFGIFAIDDFQLPQLSGQHSTILSIESSSDLSSHFILVETMMGISVIKLDTTFVKSFGRYLPVISKGCSKLVGLLVYIKETIDQLASVYKPYTDYTTRIMDLLANEIQEKTGEEDADPIYDLHDLLLTGILSEPSKTWLTDYLGDRGIKRWTKLGKQYFEGSRKLIFSRFILSLEHMIVSLTELLGLARWKENEQKLGLNEIMISTAIEIAGDILKHCYRVMTKLNEEQKYFESLISWLEAILMDVTADEKSTEPVHTRNVIYFLNSYGLRIDHNKEFASLFESLNNELDEVFKNIKSTMGEGVSSEKTVNIGEPGASDTSMQLFKYKDGFSGIISIIRDDKVEFVDFNPFDLSTRSVTVLLKDLILGDASVIAVQCEILNLNSAAILINYKINENTESKLIMFNSDTSSVLKEVVLDNQSLGFTPRYMTINRGIICLLDCTRNSYAVIQL